MVQAHKGSQLEQGSLGSIELKPDKQSSHVLNVGTAVKIFFDTATTTRKESLFPEYLLLFKQVQLQLTEGLFLNSFYSSNSNSFSCGIHFDKVLVQTHYSIVKCHFIFWLVKLDFMWDILIIGGISANQR